MKKNIFYVFFVFLICLNFFSCKTSPKYEQNETSEETFLLENGICIYVKNNPNAKVNTVELYFSTGASSLDENCLGYLNFLLDLLTTENKNCSRKELENILQEKMAEISYGSLSDYSFLRMTSLTKYFDEIFSLFSDCALEPNFTSFETLKAQAQFNFLNTKHIDYNLLMKKSGEVLRKQTNYFGKNSFTSETILALNLEKIKILYDSLFQKDKIFIIANGNFDKAKFKKQLNENFGKITLNENPTKNENQKISFDFSNTTTEINENEKNAVEFACSYKKLPRICDNEKLFAACYVANLMYSDILYNIVREQNGACYSVFSNVNLSKNPILICVGYRITDRKKFFEGIEQSKKIFAQGKIIQASSSGIGHSSEFLGFETVDATKKLESYKNILINRLYGDIFTSKQICSMMALSLTLGNNTEFMNDFASTINSVTEQDLLEAIKYISAQNEQWFYLSNTQN